MERLIEDRVKEVAAHIVMSDLTIREAAKLFGYSRSTVHKDISERLPKLDGVLYKQVRAILDHHIEVRSIKGGEATKAKFKQRGYEN